MMQYGYYISPKLQGYNEGEEVNGGYYAVSSSENWRMHDVMEERKRRKVCQFHGCVRMGRWVETEGVLTFS